MERKNLLETRDLVLKLGVQVELSRLASSRVGSHSSSARARAYRARAEPARARALGELELELFRFCS
ncbi:UNVERIFIED_CONTAM: hypothetical protein Sradi_0722900 [Sesamum radiatum]|uniref:Uncharacterized protein n=1 Tax=Sesamum radiatum TaxID=300843 RepID=A0AAW2VN55_SESRA